MPIGHVPNCATVALGVAPPITAGEPFTLSFAATLTMAVVGVPEVAKPLSLLSTMLALTTTVSVVTAQFTGVLRSHS